ncbi:MAG: DUF3318 domain-containing protein, partial [Cyanobacteria bacterium P01_A01_bin.37]
SANTSPRLDWRRMSSRIFGSGRSESWRRGEPTDSDPEMGRLLDLMPASGRMLCRLISQPIQSVVIAAEMPLPWTRSREIRINFDLWNQLPRAQRDVVFLRTVCWSTGVQWFKLDLPRGLALAGAVGVLVEAAQSDAVGVIVAGGLAALAGTQVWRQSRGTHMEIEADEAALKVAQRRGYTETEAARHLNAAIESVSRIEGRPSLNLIELLRTQNLRAIAGLSPVGVPESIRSEQ